MRFLFSIILLVSPILSPSTASAEENPTQPGPWKKSAVIALNLAQSAFSDNWKGGDRGAIAWVGLADLAAERQFSTRFNLANKLQAAYGQIAQQAIDPADPRLKIWDRPEKSTDLLAMESVGRFTLGVVVDPFVAFRGETQFRDESSPIGAIPFNPVTLKETAGIARVFEKTDSSEVLSRVGPAVRQVIAKSWVDPVTREKERFVASDGGLDWQTDVTRPILKNRVRYRGTLIVYKPLFYSKSDDLKAFDVLADSAAAAQGTTHGPVADYWKTVEVNFQNTFTAQITKLLSVNLFAQWFYDKYDAAANVDLDQPYPVLAAEIERNIRKSGQFKETLALGLSYRLF